METNDRICPQDLTVVKKWEIMRVQQNLQRIRESLPEGVTLVAVSKYHPAAAIREAYAAGQRIFGESRVQELMQKREELADLTDIEWHFIGHLQRNKVKYIAPFVSLIHSVDSPELLREIDRQGARCGRVIPCLLELHVAAETTKAGLTPEECLAMLEEGEWRSLSHVQLCGIMTMATFTDDSQQVRREFHRAYACYQSARDRYFAADPYFTIRSWGMSDDHLLAIQEGSTHVRIGTDIFGEREY